MDNLTVVKVEEMVKALEELSNACKSRKYCGDCNMIDYCMSHINSPYKWKLENWNNNEQE